MTFIIVFILFMLAICVFGFCIGKLEDDFAERVAQKVKEAKNEEQEKL